MPPKGLTRPRDPVQLAATVIGLATGEITEADVDADRAPGRRAGGLKGGAARAQTLTPKRRKEIAQAGAKARWATVQASAAQAPGKKL